MNTNVNSQDAGSLVGKAVDVRPVSEVENPEELIMNCMPAFGGAFVPSTLTPDELELAGQLRREKYATEAWNFKR